MGRMVGTMRKFLHAVFWIFIAWCFLQSCLPATGGDPCRTILYAPHWYMLHGRVDYNPYVTFLQGFGMLNLILMFYINDPSSILSTFFMMLSCLAIYTIGKREFGGFAGELGALLYATIPISRICSFFAMPEHAMVFYLLMALNGVLKYRNSYLPATKRKELVITGLMLGFAAGIDYNALIPSAIIIALAGRGFYIPLLISILVASPWYIPNIHYYGNPLYPYHAEWFTWIGPGTVDIPDCNLSQGDVGESIAISPHRLDFSPLLWVFLPTIIFIKNKKAVYSLGIFVVIALIYWMGFEHIVHARYWLPVLAALCILAGAGLATFKLWEKIATGMIVAYMVLFTIPTVPMVVAFDRQFRMDYLSRQSPGIAAIDYVNWNAYGANVYLFYLESYRYYCNFNIIGQNCGDDSFTEFVRSDDRTGWLRERDIDYLLISTSDADLYKVKLNPHYSDYEGTIGPVEIYKIERAEP
jgi:hypothetical protein